MSEPRVEPEVVAARRGKVAENVAACFEHSDQLEIAFVLGWLSGRLIGKAPPALRATLGYTYGDAHERGRLS